MKTYKLNPHDGVKKGFVWKYSETKKKMIWVTPTAGPDRRSWRKPFKFKSVELWRGEKMIVALKQASPSPFLTEDHTDRGVYTTGKTAKQLPDKPCLLVATDSAGNRYEWPIKNPRVRVD